MHIAIMAGGTGTRFWPRSRRKLPKHLLNIVGRASMLEQTVRRIAPLAPPENIVIVTTRGQKDAIRRELPWIPPTNILVEPVGRNTAASIGLAATFVARRDREEVMASLPADHVVSRASALRAVLRAAARQAAKGQELVTIGIRPTRPESGYGYIKLGRSLEKAGSQTLYWADRFVEKPSEALVKRFLSSGKYVWNSGMFICRVDTMLRMIHEHLPRLARGLERIGRAMGSPELRRILSEEYAALPSISIDYGVAEREKQVVVIPADLGWCDVGSWQALLELSSRAGNGNVILGKHVGIDSAGCLIHSPRRLVATIGIQGLVIVDTDDALLVCRADRSQDVRRVVEELEKRGLTKYL